MQLDACGPLTQGRASPEGRRTAELRQSQEATPKWRRNSLRSLEMDSETARLTIAGQEIDYCV
jgi:hypothetical protein